MELKFNYVLATESSILYTRYIYESRVHVLKYKLIVKLNYNFFHNLITITSKKSEVLLHTATFSLVKFL